MKFLTYEIFYKTDFIKKYLNQYKNNTTIFIDNFGISALNKQDWRRADKIYRDGKAFLKKELKIIDGYYLDKINEHHNYAKRFIK